LRDGGYQQTTVTVNEDEGQFVVRRNGIVVVCNLDCQAHLFQIPEATEVLLASEPGICVHHGVVTLPPESVAFLDLSQGRDGLSASWVKS
jgi:hypothetical protein